MVTKTSEVETEPAVEEHRCPVGKFRVEHDGPFFRGVFSEGQEYMGQHVMFTETCTTCNFVIQRVSHDGPCYVEEELRYFGATWSSHHQTFVHAEDDSAPGWPLRIPPERAEEIAAYFSGHPSKPTPWNTAPRERERASRGRKKKR